MKSIIEFNLDNEEDLKAHKRCVASTQLALALFELKNIKEKYKEELSFNDNLGRNEIKRRESLNYAYNSVVEIIDNVLSENNINLEEIL